MRCRLLLFLRSLRQTRRRWIYVVLKTSISPVKRRPMPGSGQTLSGENVPADPTAADDDENDDDAEGEDDED